jgi:hypothetical protein
MKRARWRSPTDIEAAYRSVSLIANNRAIFNIKGSTYHKGGLGIPAEVLIQRYLLAKSAAGPTGNREASLNERKMKSKWYPEPHAASAP